MKEIKAQRIGDRLVKFTSPVILEETSRTRRCFYGELGRDDSGEWNVRGTIVLERRGRDGWHPQDGAILGELKGGAVAKLELRTEHVKKLITGLQVLADAAKLEGIELRSTTALVVGKRDEVVQVVENQHKAVIQQLIQNNHGAEFWSTLRSLDPDITAQLADAEIHRRRRASAAEFEREMHLQRWSEANWEAFFVRNQWIFGLGLRYQFLSLLKNQANYGGANYTRKGEQKGEFLMTTEAEERFTVLIEIKRPDSPIFHTTSKESPFRSGVPGFSTEFVNAISQVQVNANTWELQGSKREADYEQLLQARIRTISPRSLLVFGHTKELDDINRRNSFELFRCRLTSPEVVTFDELLARARFIVDETRLQPGQ